MCVGGQNEERPRYRLVGIFDFQGAGDGHFFKPVEGAKQQPAEGDLFPRMTALVYV